MAWDFSDVQVSRVLRWPWIRSTWPGMEEPTKTGDGCWTKNRGILSPKMDGEQNGKAYLKFMIWGAHPYFWKHPDDYTLEKNHQPCDALKNQKTLWWWFRVAIVVNVGELWWFIIIWIYMIRSLLGWDAHFYFVLKICLSGEYQITWSDARDMSRFFLGSQEPTWHWAFLVFEKSFKLHPGLVSKEFSHRNV